MAGYFGATALNKINFGSTPIKNVYLGTTELWARASTMYGKVAAVNYAQLALSNDYFVSWTNHYNSEANMISICFSEDRFFIGAAGKIITFKDGVFTTVFSLPSSTQSVAGIVANKKNIVAWYSSTTVVSTDGGATWTVNNSAVSGILYNRNITFDGRKFVAVFSNGYVYTSTNGIAWTNISEVGSAWTQGIFYLNGRYYVSCSGNGYWKYSTNLVTWKTCANTIGETSDYSSTPYLDFINGVYTAAFITPTYQPIGYSTDGVNWKIKTQNYPIGGLNWISVNCGDRILIISSAFTASSGMSIWQTTNGIDYTKITEGSPSNNSTTGRCIAYANE